MTISARALIANRYEVLKTLTGGMGLVYLCLDRQEDRPVALKTFQPKYLSNRAARDGFLNEGNTWINLGRHPHVVRAHRVEHIGDGREVYIVLDWVAEAEGKRDASLRAWLMPDKPFPLEQALLFALNIARGMKHAVVKVPGLVHRDLKPENVLVGRDGLARVTDFGLAKAAEAVQGTQGNEETEKSLSQMQVLPSGIGGTPLYMAPEQWKQGEMLDARTDIYAFGCVLYEMVAGKFLVLGSNSELERLHRDGQAAKQAREIQGNVGELVRRCVAVKRDERYRDWAEVEVAVVAAYRRGVGKDVPMEVVAEAETRAERIAKGWSYNAIGGSYLDISKFDVAMIYFKRVMQIGQAEKERRLEASALNNLGLASWALGDLRRAIEFYEQDLTIAREIGNRHGEGAALGNLGNAYRALGNTRRAIDYYQMDLAIARDFMDRIGEGRALVNLGTAYGVLGDIQKAIECFTQCLSIMRENNNRHGEGIALGNLGNAYAYSGNKRQAIEFFEQHLTIVREIGDRRGEGQALGNLGAAYNDLGDVRQAIKYCEDSLSIRREIGDAVGAALTSFNLASILSKQGRVPEALQYTEFAEKTWAHIGNTRGVQDARRLIAQLRGQRR